MTETYIITFSSHFDAIFANRALESTGLEIQLMPVPRAVSSSCGTCVRFHAEKLPQLLEELAPEKVFRMSAGGWERLPVWKRS